jgi:hypothetical protein
MKFPRLIAMTCLSLLLAGPTWAQEEKQPEQKEQKEVCPHPEGWAPTADEMQRILADHAQWVRRWQEESGKQFPEQEWQRWILPPEIIKPQGRANLCNVNWVKIKIEDATLLGAKLNNADLQNAQLNNANLRHAQLNNATLTKAKLNNADLRFAKLNNADLMVAQLNNANLSLAQLNNANLSFAELNNADLADAKLINAYLPFARLNNANLVQAQLNNADLENAQLKNADLLSVSLSGAKLAFADLTDAVYAPESAAPDPHVVGINGLDTIRIPLGRETGLVQLRDLLQKAGLRDLEREATFSIEYWRTRYAIFAERFFRMAAFEWTTAYGLYPGRALKIILMVWILLSLVYFWPIYLAPKGSSTGGIYQVWSADRIETSGEAVSLSNSPKVNRLKTGPLGALGYAAYFSLLSAFYIGWRELSVGNWIARIQPREYALRATGWVRAVSGVQSLLSVYLLAIWVLTYFGRPFQ